ncbi:hypothetical protein ACHAXS_002288 [Conticribra weissflogii]
MNFHGSPLFVSPSFLAVEIGFLLVASIAAYELFIGDFVWAIDEEERRKSLNRRGRGMADNDVGYEPLEGRQLYQSRGEYDRSLSPGREGRGTKGSNLQARREYGNSGMGNRYAASDGMDGGYYASPGGRSNPGKGSTGDTTRRLFYKLILAALLSRFFLLPVETYCFSLTNYSEVVTLRIMLRICQTLPDIAFSSALSLLVIFCAQIAFAAMPPLSPRASDSLADDDDAETDVAGEVKDTEEDDMAGYDGLLSIGKLHQLKEDDNGQQSTKAFRRRNNCSLAICMQMARCSRTVLAAKHTFLVWNVVLLVSYALLLLCLFVIPLMTNSIYETSLWIFLAMDYSVLLVSLFYVGVLLGKALRPGMVRRQGVDSLAYRLLGSCILLVWVFSEKVVSFSLVAHHSLCGIDGMLSYKRDALQYTSVELLPVLALLLLMHRNRKKERHHEPDVIHSLMNNIFGSTGWLGTSEGAVVDAPKTVANPIDTGGNSGPTGSTGASASRRFKTYGGGTRGDSFPPATGNRQGVQQHMPRAPSSSGDTDRNSKPKQQLSNNHGAGSSSLVGGGASVTYGATDNMIR